MCAVCNVLPHYILGLYDVHVHNTMFPLTLLSPETDAWLYTLALTLISGYTPGSKAGQVI